MIARLATVLVGSALALAACVEALSLEDRTCPCLDVGWFCCKLTGTCMREAEAGSCSAPMGAPPGLVPRGPRGGPDAAAAGPAAEPEAPCQAPARACSADRSATLTCGERGRWDFERTCLDGTICSAGACVCRMGSCHEGVLVRSEGGITGVGVGGEALYYRAATFASGLGALHRLNLRTGETSILVVEAPDTRVGLGGIDSMGVVTWCRETRAFPGESAIMRGTELLEPIRCDQIAVSDTHVFFTVTEGGLPGAAEPGKSELFRRAVDRPGRELLWEAERPPMTITVAGRYLYFSAYPRGEDLGSIHLNRIAIDGPQPGPLERVAVLTSSQPSLYRIAADEGYVYGVDEDGVLWAPATPGSSPLQTLWRGDGDMVSGLAVSPTHVYWSTQFRGVSGCATATVWRKPKAGGGEAEPVARYPGCVSANLLLHGEYLYTAISSLLGGAQIVRLHR